MKIEIYDYLGICERLAKGPVDHVISINSPRVPAPNAVQRFQGSCLQLVFDDLEEGETAPTEEHVEEILEFGEKIKPGETVAIHCMAGISRSAATALILLVSREPRTFAGAEAAIRKLYEIKSNIRPNARMVTFADRLLGFNDQIFHAYRVYNRIKIDWD